MSLNDIIKFILGFIFKKDELDFRTSKFNYPKFILVLLLMLSLSINVTLVKTIDKIRVKAEIHCPSILRSESKKIKK